MRKSPGALPGSMVAAGLLLVGLSLPGCATQAATETEADTFPIGSKNLFPPELFDRDLVVAVGQPSAEVIEQPIAFPHNTHVQTLGIDCQYCHSAARKGIHAGVPPTQVCMGCHSQITSEGRPELEKLVAFWADGTGEPIPWVKVHDLPDFVYFSHKRHVVGGVQCGECHGAVQDMTVNQRVSSLEMGWCLDCHAQHEKIDETYGVRAELRRAELKDCWTCHK